MHLVLLCKFRPLIHMLPANCCHSDDIQPSKLSFNLHYFLPSMTVEFPSVQSLTACVLKIILSSHNADNLAKGMAK